MSWTDIFSRQKKPNIFIAPAQNEDIPEIADLHGKCFARGWGSTEFERLLSSKDQLCFVAKELHDKKSIRRKILGFILVKQFESEAEILTLAVSPNSWGYGIGRKLLYKIMDVLRYSPAKDLFIEVSEQNERALSLYRHAGFEKVGQRDAYYKNKDGSKATALVMSVQLG